MVVRILITFRFNLAIACTKMGYSIQISPTPVEDFLILHSHVIYTPMCKIVLKRTILYMGVFI